MSSPTSWPTSASAPAAATVEADLGYGPIDNAIHVQPQRVARCEVRSQVRRGELRLEQCQSTVGAESSDGTNLLCHLVDAARLPNSKAGQNCEEMLTEQAERVLKEDPGIVGEQPRVWVYRNTIKVTHARAHRWACATFAFFCMHYLIVRTGFELVHVGKREA